MNILFVCSSNACRSPYCEFVFRRRMEDRPDLIISSAGVLNPLGNMDFRTKRVLREQGFPEEELNDFRSAFRWNHPERFDAADVIIGMSAEHGKLLPKKWRSKFTTLSEAATGAYTAIPDPWFCLRRRKYDAILHELDRYLEQYAEQLETN